MNDDIKQAGNSNTTSRAAFIRLNQSFRKTNHRQKVPSYITPNIWNNTLNYLKTTKGFN